MKKFGGINKKTLPQGLTGIQQAIEVKRMKKKAKEANEAIIEAMAVAAAINKK